MQRLASGEYIIFVDQPEGNAYSILGIVSKMLCQIYGDAAQPKIDAYMKAAKSGDYENLKSVSTEAVGGLLTFGVSTDYEVTVTRR